MRLPIVIGTLALALTLTACGSRDEGQEVTFGVTVETYPSKTPATVHITPDPDTGALGLLHDRVTGSVTQPEWLASS
ncbi:hypothetical protein [Prescottella agglutinans]|uniref:hypothetical protein n=1 Tax=Prescottella agglutinans TaxID=1644129 RepID=UPI003D981E2B